MKKALTNAAIYFVIAAALYIVILALPEQITFYGLMLFYLIHLLGVLITKPFYCFSTLVQNYAL